ncbi:MAG: phosphotransferase enzyme family protein [Bacillota bacterium]
MTGGYLHRTYRAESPEGPLFLKLYSGPDWPRERVAEACRVQQLLHQAGHPVPSLLCPPLEVAGGVLVAMAFLPGAPVERPGPATARAAGAALGRIHRTLQPLPVPQPPPVPETGATRAQAAALLAAAQSQPAPDELDRLAAEAAAFRLRWLEAHPIQPETYAAAVAHLVHGDYYPGNLLFTAPDRLSGVVDFDFVSVRFRGLEVGRALVETALRPDGRFDAGTAAPLLRAYLEENPLPPAERVSGFRIWLEYLLWSLYPLPLRYAGAPLPQHAAALARRRHHLLRWLAEHLSDLERLAATI